MRKGSQAVDERFCFGERVGRLFKAGLEGVKVRHFVLLRSGVAHESVKPVEFFRIYFSDISELVIVVTYESTA